MSSHYRILPLSLMLGGSIFIAACNSGTSDSAAPATGSTSNSASGKSISGIAATGAAIAGANVALKCSAGAAASTTTANDGSYSIALTNQLAPCVLAVAGGQIDGVANTQVLHSAAASAGGTANITPLTELALAQAIQGDPATFFNNFSAPLAGKITASALQQAQLMLNAQLVGLQGAASAGQIGDYFTGNLQPGNPSNPMDVFLDNLGIGLDGANVPLSSIVATISGGGTLQQLLGSIVPGVVPGTNNIPGSANASSCLYVAQAGDNANFRESGGNGAGSTSYSWENGSYGGASVLVMKEYDAGNILTSVQYQQYLATNAMKVLLLEGYANGSKTMESTQSPNQALVFPTAIGQSLSYTSTISNKGIGAMAAALQGKYGTDTLTAKLVTSIRYVGNESVTVPAGTFNACKFETKSQFSDFLSALLADNYFTSNTTVSWYAPGVGEVKSVITTSTSAGNMVSTSELQSGRFSGIGKP